MMVIDIFPLLWDFTVYYGYTIHILWSDGSGTIKYKNKSLEMR